MLYLIMISRPLLAMQSLAVYLNDLIKDRLFDEVVSRIITEFQNIFIKL